MTKTIASESALPDDGVHRVKVDGRDMLLVKSGEWVRLFRNRCPHDGSPMHKGRVDSGVIRCPKHGICFSLESGEPLGGEAVGSVAALEFIPVRQVGDNFVVDEA